MSATAIPRAGHRPGRTLFQVALAEGPQGRVATQAVDLTWDPTKRQATIEAVTKDNLTTGVNGQIRFRVVGGQPLRLSLRGRSPLEHVMGYFISVLRERIANFVDPKGASAGNRPRLGDARGVQ